VLCSADPRTGRRVRLGAALSGQWWRSQVVKQCVDTEGVEPTYVRTEILPEFFRAFWVRRMALDRRNYRQLVETTVALAQKARAPCAPAPPHPNLTFGAARASGLHARCVGGPAQRAAPHPERQVRASCSTQGRRRAARPATLIEGARRAPTGRLRARRWAARRSWAASWRTSRTRASRTGAWSWRPWTRCGRHSRGA
jgi:hypothetical protein